MKETRRYRAFISYSHSTDKRFAPALQSALMKYAKPWYKLRAFSIFRDETDLSASPGLWDSIENALSDSDYFILLASPQAAVSEWVAKEILWWLENRSVDSLLIGLTRGNIGWDSAVSDFDWSSTDAIPKLLRSRLSQEPHYVDLRWVRSKERLSVDDKQFSEAVLDFAATLHGISKSDLASEELRQHKRTLTLAWSAVGVISVAAIAAIGMAIVAIDQRQQAERNLLTALSRQLSAQAVTLSASQFDLSLLLAVEATKIEQEVAEEEGRRNSIEAFGSLFTVLSAHPELTQYFKPAHDAVAPIAVSSDGSTLAYARTAGQIGLYFISSGSPLESPTIPNLRQAERIEYSPTGEFLAVGDRDGKIHLWDTRTRKSERTLLPHDGSTNTRVTDIAFSPDGKLVATIWNDKSTVGVWSTEHQEQIGSIESMQETGEIMSIAFGQSGLLAAAGGRGTVTLWDLSEPQNPRSIGALPVHYGTAHAVAFSQDGTILATAGADGPYFVHLWNLEEPTLPRAIGSPVTAHQDGVQELAFAPSGEVLASGDRAGNIFLWDTATGKPDGSPLRAHSGAVHSIDFVGSDKRIVTTSRKHSAWIHSHAHLPESNEILRWDLSVEHRLGSRWPDRDMEPQDLTALSARLEGIRKAAALQNSLDTFAQRHVLHVPQARVAYRGLGTKLIFSPASPVVAFNDCLRRQDLRCVQGTIRLADIESGTLFSRPTDTHESDISAMAITPDGGMIATGDFDGKVAFWDASEASHTTLINGPTKVDNFLIGSLAFDPKGEILAVGGTRGKLLIWDASDRARPRIIFDAPRAHGNFVTDLAFHPHSGILAASSYDQTIGLWDTSTPAETQRIASLSGPTGLITSVDFSASGDLVVATSNDGTIWLWDYRTQRLFGQFFQSIANRSAPARFASVGARLVAENTADRKDLHLASWDFDLASWRARACEIANRELTEAERQTYIGVGRTDRACAEIP